MATNDLMTNEIIKIESDDESDQIVASPKLEKLSDIIVPFNNDAGMRFEKWLILFDATCKELNKNETWKLRNISKFLKGNALTIFVNNCLEVSTWKELCEILKEEFCEPTSNSFYEFTNLKFRTGEDIMNYFRKKTNIGKALKLNRELILEGLTDGLPINMRQLLTINPPQNLLDWINVASKLAKMQKTYPTNEPPKKPNFQKPSPNQNRFSQGNYSRPYQGNSANQNQTQQESSRAPNSSGNRNGNSGSESRKTPPQTNNKSNNRTRPPVQSAHHNFERLPPSPCWECESRGILNAFHWVQTCPFRNNAQCIPEQVNPTPETGANPQ